MQPLPKEREVDCNRFSRYISFYSSTALHSCFFMPAFTAKWNAMNNKMSISTIRVMSTTPLINVLINTKKICSSNIATSAQCCDSPMRNSL